MRPTPNIRLETHRRRHPSIGWSEAGSNWGYFEIGALRVISSGEPDERTEAAGWEHVSVSRADRIPSWDDMKLVKELFWSDDETVVQFHPRKEAYVSAHPFVLHLWRRAGVEPDLPPRSLIA